MWVCKYICICIFIYIYDTYKKTGIVHLHLHLCQTWETQTEAFMRNGDQPSKAKKIQGTRLRSSWKLTTSCHPSGLSSTSMIATIMFIQSPPKKSLRIKNLVKNWVLPNSWNSMSPTTSGPFSKNLPCGRFLPRLSRLHHWALRRPEKFHVQLIRGRSDTKKTGNPTCTWLVFFFKNSETIAVSSHIVPHCSCLAALLMVH